MALLHKGGGECLLSSLELFSVPPTQASIDRAQFTRFWPVMNLNSGPLEFKFITSDNEFCDLTNVYLYTKNRILDGQGKPIPPTSGADDDFNTSGIVFPVNNFHSSRFKSLEVYINNQQVNESDNMFHYRSYIQTLLSFNKGTKDTVGRMLLWAKDNKPDGNFSELDVESENELSDAVNLGAYRRFQATKFSKPFETFGKVHADLFCQERFLPSNTEVRLRFHRADTDFSLMAQEAGKKFTIVLDSAILFVRYVEISSSVREAIAKAALNSNFKFPVRKIKSLFFSHSAGRQDLSVHSLVTGRLPRRVIVAFTLSSSFHGSLNSSPFCFQNFQITTILVRANSQSFPCETGIETDFKHGAFLQGYFSLLQGTNNLFTNTDIDIAPTEDYANENCLFGFDLSPEMQSGSTDHFDLIREGNLDIEVKLDTPIENSVTMIVLLEYDHVIEMTADGDVVSEP